MTHPVLNTTQLIITNYKMKYKIAFKVMLQLNE